MQIVKFIAGFVAGWLFLTTLLGRRQWMAK